MSIQTDNPNNPIELINNMKKQLAEQIIIIRNNNINKLIELISNFINEKEACAIFIYFNMMYHNIDKILEFNKLRDLIYKDYYECSMDDRHTSMNVDTVIYNGPPPLSKNEASRELITTLICDEQFQCLIKGTDQNTLLVLKLFNRFANNEKIRVEDAITIFKEYVYTVYK